MTLQEAMKKMLSPAAYDRMLRVVNKMPANGDMSGMALDSELMAALQGVANEIPGLNREELELSGDPEKTFNCNMRLLDAIIEHKNFEELPPINEPDAPLSRTHIEDFGFAVTEARSASAVFAMTNEAIDRAVDVRDALPAHECGLYPALPCEPLVISTIHGLVVHHRSYLGAELNLLMAGEVGRAYHTPTQTSSISVAGRVEQPDTVLKIYPANAAFVITFFCPNARMAITLLGVLGSHLTQEHGETRRFVIVRASVLGLDDLSPGLNQKPGTGSVGMLANSNPSFQSLANTLSAHMFAAYLAALHYIDTPAQYVVQETPEHILGKSERYNKLKAKKAVRYADRERWLVLSPEEVKVRWPQRTHQGGSHASPVPHMRKGHTKLLVNERYVHKRGQLIRVRPSWVGDREWNNGRAKYKVISRVGAEADQA